MSNQETNSSNNLVSSIVDGIRAARESANVGTQRESDSVETQSDMHSPNHHLLQNQEEGVMAPAFDYELVAGVGLMPTVPPQGPIEQ